MMTRLMPLNLIRCAALLCCVAAWSIFGCAPQAPEVTVTMKSAEEGESVDTEVPASTSGTETTEVVAEGGFGDLVGTILFDGTPPAPEVLIAQGDSNVRDAAVCAAEAIPSEKLLVDANTKGIQNVFVYLEKAPKGGKEAPPAEAAVFDQKGCRFLPHALLMQTKQVVLVKSQDPVAHNTHTFPDRNPVFNTAIKVNERDGVPLVYDKPERQPVEVKCDFHPWMQAFHLPLDHPYMAITDETGKFQIADLPSGTHNFRVWHEKGGLLERGYKVVIKPGMPNEISISYGSNKFARFDGPRPRQVILPAARLSPLSGSSLLGR